MSIDLNKNQINDTDPTITELEQGNILVEQATTDDGYTKATRHAMWRYVFSTMMETGQPYASYPQSHRMPRGKVDVENPPAVMVTDNFRYSTNTHRAEEVALNVIGTAPDAATCFAIYEQVDEYTQTREDWRRRFLQNLVNGGIQSAEDGSFAEQAIIDLADKDNLIADMNAPVRRFLEQADPIEDANRIAGVAALIQHFNQDGLLGDHFTSSSLFSAKALSHPQIAAVLANSILSQEEPKKLSDKERALNSTIARKVIRLYMEALAEKPGVKKETVLGLLGYMFPNKNRFESMDTRWLNDIANQVRIRDGEDTITGNAHETIPDDLEKMLHEVYADDITEETKGQLNYDTQMIATLMAALLQSKEVSPEA